MRCKFLIFLVTAAFFTGCGQKQATNLAPQQAVAKVNKYTITVDDFNHETGFMRPVFRNFSSIPPMELKLGILDELINRELLLEEAQKINIDKDPEFMRQIENFWRLSLIKRLLKHKLTEIEAVTTVSDEQVKAEYIRETSQMASPKPLKELAPKIREVIFRLKVQEALQEWEDSLKPKAAIKRYYGVLNSIPVDFSKGG